MDKKKVYQSLSDCVYNGIRADILSGKYKPGYKLVEMSFQEEYGISKSPVREAFQMLINDGLVERKARRGCFVKVFDDKQIREVYEVRMILEGYAAMQAYERMTESKIVKLKDLYLLMKEDASINDSEAYFNHHEEFQGFFGKESGNNSLYEFCSKLRIQNLWYNMQFFQLDLTEDLHTHDELLNHFEKHDVTSMEIKEIMENHIKLGLNNFNSYSSSLKRNSGKNDKKDSNKAKKN